MPALPARTRGLIHDFVSRLLPFDCQLLSSRAKVVKRRLFAFVCEQIALNGPSQPHLVAFNRARIVDVGCSPRLRYLESGLC